MAMNYLNNVYYSALFITLSNIIKQRYVQELSDIFAQDEATIRRLLGTKEGHRNLQLSDNGRITQNVQLKYRGRRTELGLYADEYKQLSIYRYIEEASKKIFLFPDFSCDGSLEKAKDHFCVTIKEILKTNETAGFHGKYLTENEVKILNEMLSQIDSTNEYSQIIKMLVEQARSPEADYVIHRTQVITQPNDVNEDILNNPQIQQNKAQTKEIFINTDITKQMFNYSPYDSLKIAKQKDMLQHYLKAKSYNMLVSAARIIINSETHLPSTYIYLAKGLYYTGQKNEALQALDDLMVSYNDNVDTLLQVTNVALYEFKDVKYARYCTDLMIKYGWKDNEYVATYDALLYLYQQGPSNAITKAREYIAKHPNYDYFRKTIGNELANRTDYLYMQKMKNGCYFKTKKDLESWLQDYEKYIEINPALAQIYQQQKSLLLPSQILEKPSRWWGIASSLFLAIIFYGNMPLAYSFILIAILIFIFSMAPAWIVQRYNCTGECPLVYSFFYRFRYIISIPLIFLTWFISVGFFHVNLFGFDDTEDITESSVIPTKLYRLVLSLLLMVFLVFSSICLIVDSNNSKESAIIKSVNAPITTPTDLEQKDLPHESMLDIVATP